MKYWKLVSITIALSLSTSVFAAKINVPEDFPNSFHMDLLSGSVIVDYESGVAAPGELEVLPTGGISQIEFEASAFGGSSGPGEGTSNLSLSHTYSELASFTFGGVEGSFFINGTGKGTLVDNGNGSGEWSMDLPLFAEWGGNIFDFSDINLSTNASYNYNSAILDPVWGDVIGSEVRTINGISMDYESGDAFLVGQSSITDPNHPWYGMRITLGLDGNDPIIATPVPAAVWLFGSGLIGLASIARRKKV